MKSVTKMKLIKFGGTWLSQRVLFVERVVYNDHTYLKFSKVSKIMPQNAKNLKALDS
jgi:hypothetical protein